MRYSSCSPGPVTDSSLLGFHEELPRHFQGFPWVYCNSKSLLPFSVYLFNRVEWFFIVRLLFCIVQEVQVGMGPGGELRYPSCPTEKLMEPTGEPELGEFQCYDKVRHQI